MHPPLIVPVRGDCVGVREVIQHPPQSARGRHHVTEEEIFLSPVRRSSRMNWKMTYGVVDRPPFPFQAREHSPGQLGSPDGYGAARGLGRFCHVLARGRLPAG